MKFKLSRFQSQTKKRVTSYIVVFVVTGIFSKNQCIITLIDSFPPLPKIYYSIFALTVLSLCCNLLEQYYYWNVDFLLSVLVMGYEAQQLVTERHTFHLRPIAKDPYSVLVLYYFQVIK